MSLFTVDHKKCNHDGICVDECPLGIIRLEEKDNIPLPVEGAEDLCINCGHCVAVCPSGALSHQGMTPEQCPPLQKELLLNSEQAEHFLRARRSVRVYKDKSVERETLAKLIDIARFAPSGHNGQPVKWLVIYDSAEVQRLSGLVVDWMRYMVKEQPEMASLLNMDRVIKAWESGIDSICRSAPHVIVAHAPGENRTGPTSGTIALTYLELAAQPLGLGACWGGFFNAGATMWPPMQKALNLPEGHISLGAMMVGYPKYKYHRLPLRNEPEISWRLAVDS